MSFDNYFGIGKQFHYTILYVLFILDFMNSVGIAELNTIFNVSFWCEEKRDDPVSANILILIFRLVWKFQKTKPEVENKVPCDNIRPEVLATLKSFPKKFRTFTLDFVFGYLYTNNSAVLLVELRLIREKHFNSTCNTN